PQDEEARAGSEREQEHRDGSEHFLHGAITSGCDRGRRGVAYPRLTNVPTPRSVKVSSSREWGTRPSRMTAPSTPPSTASRQVSSLGIIPPEIVPSLIRTLTCETVRFSRSLPSLSSTPGTSVSSSRRVAPTAAAMAPAAVSALIL